jgi:hypothetical protein
MGDQPVPRPLPTHRAAQTQNKDTDTYALSGIQTHDPSVREVHAYFSAQLLVVHEC